MITDAAPDGLDLLVYASRSTALGAAERRADLADAFAASRRNNPSRGITGALGVAGPWFLQALEGPPPALAALWDRLAADPRHGEPRELDRRAVGRERRFARWRMGDAGELPEEVARAVLGGGPTGLAPAPPKEAAALLLLALEGALLGRDDADGLEEGLDPALAEALRADA